MKTETNWIVILEGFVQADSEMRRRHCSEQRLMDDDALFGLTDDVVELIY